MQLNPQKLRFYQRGKGIYTQGGQKCNAGNMMGRQSEIYDGEGRGRQDRVSQEVRHYIRVHGGPY